MQNIRHYVRAQSLEEAYTLNQKRTSRIIGGMLWLKMGRGNITTAIDLCDLGLDQIEEDDQQFTIGAMVTLRQLEQHAAFETYCSGVFSKAVSDIVGVQFRNLATIGGSIWGRFGFSDVLTVLLSMDCYVQLYQGGLISLAEFAVRKADNDILTHIIVRKTPGKFAYQAMRIQRTDFPVLTCAVSTCGDSVQAVIGARPGRACVIADQEKILGETFSEEAILTFAAYVSSTITTGSNLRGSSAYRKHLAKILTVRALTELGGM